MENTPTPTNLPPKEVHPLIKPPAPKEVHLPKKEEKKEEHKSGMATKVLAIIGLAVILALLSFGIVKFAPNTIKFLTSAAVSLSAKFIPGKSFFAGPLTLTSDNTSLNTGDAFTLNWTKNNEEEGMYTVSYPCTNGFHLEAPQDSDKIVLTCDTRYSFESDTNTLDLIAFSLQSPSQDVPIVLDFIKEGSEEVAYSATLDITVKNPDLELDTNTQLSPLPSPSTSPTPQNIASPRTSVSPPPTSYVVTQPLPVEDQNGKADFVIRILETGVVSKSTGAFTQKAEIRKTEKAAVRFEIENIGTKRSGVWTFESKLPTKRSYTFESENQVALMPHDKIQFILGFDEFKDVSTLTFSINVDPEDDEDELRENNNIEFVSIDVDN